MDVTDHVKKNQWNEAIEILLGFMKSHHKERIIGEDTVLLCGDVGIVGMVLPVREGVI